MEYIFCVAAVEWLWTGETKSAGDNISNTVSNNAGNHSTNSDTNSHGNSGTNIYSDPGTNGNLHTNLYSYVNVYSCTYLYADAY